MFLKQVSAASVHALGQGRLDKRTPERNGYHADVGGLYVKHAPLCGAKAVGCVEIGNLGRVTKGQLPDGVAGIEVLCNRQSLFGNPFNLLKAEGPRRAKGKMHISDAVCPVAEGANSRDDVCRAFAEFLDTILLPTTNGRLAEIAEAIACRRGLSTTVIGREWRRDFGPRLCVDFRAAFLVLQDMARTRCRDGKPGIRLMCHCVPLPCHCESLAMRLAKPPASASEQAVTVLSPSKRDVLRLTEKLGTNSEIGTRLAQGGVLATNQHEKVVACEAHCADFEHARSLLPPGPDALCMVNDAVGPRELGVVDPSVAEVGDMLSSQALDVDALVAGENVQNAPVRRWRMRGGRSGFSRKYDADHK